MIQLNFIFSYEWFVALSSDETHNGGYIASHPWSTTFVEQLTLTFITT